MRLALVNMPSLLNGAIIPCAEREDTMRYLLSSAVIAGLALGHVQAASAAEVTLIAPGGIRAAVEQMIPPPLARRSVQTPPDGQVSPAQQ